MKKFLQFLFASMLFFVLSLPTYAQVKSISDFQKLSKSEQQAFRESINQRILDKGVSHKYLRSSQSKASAKFPGPNQFITYNNRNTFTSLYTNLTMENFAIADPRVAEFGEMFGALMDFPVNTSTDNDIFHRGDIVNGISFTIHCPVDESSDWFVAGPHYTNWQDTQYGNMHSIMGPDFFADQLEIDFSPAVVNAGFDLYPFYSEDYTDVYVYDQDGNPIGYTQAMSTFNGSFFGIHAINGKTIGKIILDKQVDPDIYHTSYDAELVGNVVFGLQPLVSLSNMEESWLFYGNRFALKNITNTTTITGAATCSGAKVQITQNYVQGKDLLVLNPVGGVTGRFDVLTGTLTLSGVAPTSAYQTALQNIYYLYFSPTIPSTTPNRQVSVTVNSGDAVSNTVFRVITFNNMMTKPLASNSNLTSETKPTEYTLYQNYPNPFNPTTSIRFAIPKDGFVTLKVYNILGEEVATLMNENASAGIYQVPFDGSKLSSGTYIYRLTSGNFVETKKFVLMK